MSQTEGVWGAASKAIDLKAVSLQCATVHLFFLALKLATPVSAHKGIMPISAAASRYPATHENTMRN